MTHRRGSDGNQTTICFWLGTLDFFVGFFFFAYFVLVHNFSAKPSLSLLQQPKNTEKSFSEKGFPKNMKRRANGFIALYSYTNQA